MLYNRKIIQLIAGMCLLSSATSAHAFDWLSNSTDSQPLKWDWQLVVPVQLNTDSSIGIYDIDMFDNESTGAVGLLQSYGKKVICYVDVGSWEDYRDDKYDFPISILGNQYEGFPDERWLDIRDLNPEKSTTGTRLASILEARFDRAKQMGCDAIEPDNMDVYDETAHDPSGFPLTYEDNIFFNLWVAEAAHSRGMAVGLKNNINQARDARIIEAFDFVVSEECVQYGECDFYDGFLDSGKPVFLAEYSLDPQDFCATAMDLGISAIKKRNRLDSFRGNCDSYYSDADTNLPAPLQSVCDYSDADLYGGWGWNYETSESCAPPEEQDDTTQQEVVEESVANSCDYSDGHLFGGWGWNYETSESCAPPEEQEDTTQQEVIDDTIASSCDYSDGHLFGGWGWNYQTSESCAPPEEQEDTTQQEVIDDTIASSCDYSDGQLFGGSGGNNQTSESCAPPEEQEDTTQQEVIDDPIASSCDYSDGHLYGGWGWNYQTSKSCAPVE